MQNEVVRNLVINTKEELSRPGFTLRFTTGLVDKDLGVLDSGAVWFRLQILDNNVVDIDLNIVVGADRKLGLSSNKENPSNSY